MRSILLLSIAMLLPLAACGRSDTPANDGEEPDNLVLDETDIAEEDGPSEQPPVEEDAPSTLVTDRSQLPSAFLGKWTGPDESCENDIATTRLVIKPRALQFYESQGTILAVKQAGKRSAHISVSYEGEGQSWNRDQTLLLSESGTRLTISDEAGSSIRKRCAP